jgi:hypothetical protein
MQVESSWAQQNCIIMGRAIDVIIYHDAVHSLMNYAESFVIGQLVSSLECHEAFTLLRSEAWISEWNARSAANRSITLLIFLRAFCPTKYRPRFTIVSWSIPYTSFSYTASPPSVFMSVRYFFASLTRLVERGCKSPSKLTFDSRSSKILPLASYMAKNLLFINTV